MSFPTFHSGLAPTLGDATDFGDLTVARGNLVGVSDAHGGLG